MSFIELGNKEFHWSNGLSILLETLSRHLFRKNGRRCLREEFMVALAVKKYFWWQISSEGKWNRFSATTDYGHTPQSHHRRTWSNMVGNQKPWYHGQTVAGVIEREGLIDLEDLRCWKKWRVTVGIQDQESV